jgi:hypothetical protein
LKKQQKEAEKAAKKQEKQEQKQAASGAADEGADDCAKGLYGALPMIQSKEKLDRTLVSLKELTPARADQKLWVRGRLHTSRAVGRYFTVKIIIGTGLRKLQICILINRDADFHIVQ